MTPEETLVRRYFEAFNLRDIDGVMACFHDDAVRISANGRRQIGRAELRRSYECSFAMFPDGRCDLRLCAGETGHAMAESIFRGTNRERGPVEMKGVETIEIADGKIKEIRDYHQQTSAAEDGCSARRIMFGPPRARVYR